MLNFKKEIKIPLHVVIVSIVLAFLLGALLGYLVGRAPQITEKTPETPTQTGAIPPDFVEPVLPLPEEPAVAIETTTLSGVIRSLKDGRLIFEASYPGSDIIEREADIGEDTEIKIYRPMTIAELDKEDQARKAEQAKLENRLKSFASGREYLSVRTRITSQETSLNNLRRRFSELSSVPEVREILNELDRLNTEENMAKKVHQFITVDGGLEDLVPDLSITITSDTNIAQAKKITPQKITIIIPVELILSAPDIP